MAAEGIWDDGEWISWEEINNCIYDQELTEQYPEADSDVVRIFDELVSNAQDYQVVTGRYLQIWGELGEIYAEIKFGLIRNRVGAQGSDGKIGNDHVEVKTISPEKSDLSVHVKRSGNFNKLLVVKIDSDFEFEAQLIDRKALGKGKGKYAKAAWKSDENL